MSLLPFIVRPKPVTVEECIAALQELVDASYGRTEIYHDPTREYRARLEAMELIERHRKEPR